MSNNDNLNTLQNLFPTLDGSIIQAVLEQTGSVDAALDPLLSLAAQENKTEAPMPEEPKPAAPSPDSTDPELALLQQRIAALRKEAETEIAAKEDNKGPSQEPLLPVPVESTDELLAREIQIQELRSELEHTITVSEPGRIEMAMNQIRAHFYELKAKGGDISAEKLMTQMKQALAFIEVTLRNIANRATVLGKKVKDEVESWRLLEKLEEFANTLRAEFRASIANMRAQRTNQGEQQQLEEYLAKLDEKSEVISETKQN